MDNLLQQYSYNEPGQIKRLKIDAINEYPLLLNDWNNGSSISFTDWIANQDFNYIDGEPIWNPSLGLEEIDSNDYKIFDPTLPSLISPTYNPPDFDCPKITAYIKEYYDSIGEEVPEIISEEAIIYMSNKIKNDPSAILGVDYIYPTDDYIHGYFIDHPIYTNVDIIPICSESAIHNWLSLRASNGNSRVYQLISIVYKFRKAAVSTHTYSNVIEDAKKYTPSVTTTASVREYRNVKYTGACDTLSAMNNFNKITSTKEYTIAPFSFGTFTLRNSIISNKYSEGCTHYDSSRSDIYDEGVNDILSTYVDIPKKVCNSRGWMYRLIGMTDDTNNNLPCPLQKNTYTPKSIITFNKPIAKYLTIKRSPSDSLLGLTKVSNVQLSLDDNFTLINDNSIQIPDTIGTFDIIYSGSEITNCNKGTLLCNFNVCKSTNTTITIVKPGKLPGEDADTKVTNMVYEHGDVSVKINNIAIADSKLLFYNENNDRTTVKQIVTDNLLATTENTHVSGHTEYDYDVPGIRYHVSEYYYLDNIRHFKCGNTTISLVLLYSELIIRMQDVH